MTEFKIGDKVWVKGVINQIDKGNVWDLYISTRENGVWIDSCLDECIPQNDTDEKPRYLRNVLARLRELPEHDRKVWMDEIMHEFANDVEAGKSKVVIPQFVADWIDYCKENHFTITGAFDPVSEYGIGIAGTFKGSVYKCTRWALDNQNLFARAWLDGYEVEQEKRYRIKMKNEKYNHTVVIGDCTRKELDDAGFEWVFDCEDVEVQEV